MISLRLLLVVLLVPNVLCHGLAEDTSLHGPGTTQKVWDSKQHAYGHSTVSNSAIFRFQHERELFYELGGNQYFSPNLPVARAALPTPLQEYSAITIIDRPSNTMISPAELLKIVNSYLSSDDVLTAWWLDTIILTPSLDSQRRVDPEELSLKHHKLAEAKLNSGTVFHHPEIQPTSVSTMGGRRWHQLDEKIPSSIRGLKGPYLARYDAVSGLSDLLPVFRLYSDTFRTFLFGMYPTQGGYYKLLRKVDEDGYNLIPLPSRLYKQCLEDDGVCGQRIGVKDLYDIKGVKTSAGSRSWGKIYGAANVTAPAIQRLIDLGGVIVGKTKTASFAVGSAHGVNDTVDEQYPFSARGDLWQTCLGSSSGSACAMGAYDWLDLAIGTDTGGSVRAPASIVGLYGNRPSHGALSLDAVVPLIDRQDTAGLLARDPVLFSKGMKSWYGESPLNFTEFNQWPSRILVDDQFASFYEPKALAVVEKFITQFGSLLDMKVSKWNATKALAAANYTWEQVDTGFADAKTWGWYTWNHNGKGFYEDYSALHDGRTPPVDPNIRHIWHMARDQNVTEGQYLAAKDDIARFASFINEDLLGYHEKRCSKNLLIYDIGYGGRPRYRTGDLGNTNPSLEGKKVLDTFCPLAGCVDITIPIGQIPSMSVISEREELVPVTINMVARRGCDFMLANLVQKMSEVGLIQSTKTGRTAF